MKTAALLVLAATLCAAASADRDMSTHVRIRVNAKTPGHLQVSKPVHGKFYVTPLGQQCAYDPKNDPSMYPCRDGGVCIRTSPTYGKCFTKEEAAKLQATSSDGSDSEDDADVGDDADDDDDDETDSSASLAGAVQVGATSNHTSSHSGSGSQAHHDAEVGDDDGEDDDEEDDDGASEDDDDEEVATTAPPAKKASKKH